MSSSIVSCKKRFFDKWFYKPCENPVIILGNEKSGTTVIAASLGEACQLSVTLDIEGLWDPIQTKIHRNEISLRTVINNNSREFSRSIIKEPVLTFEYEKLKIRFPNARFLLVIRDPRDNIRSILDRLGLPGNLDYLKDSHITGLGQLWRTWNTVIDNKWLGIESKNYIESMAKRWNTVANLYLQNSRELILLRYEDFKLDKITEIYRTAKALGLSPTKDISEIVCQQFQHKGNSDIDFNLFFGSENLNIINKTCAENMKCLGYEV